MRAPGHIALAAVAMLTATAAVFAHAGPQSDTAWTVRSGRVRVICPMTVGGSFEAVTTAITGSAGAAAGADPLSGSFAVDLATLDTGIALRNTHLRDKYLETDRGEGFAHARLTDIRLADIDAADPNGRGTFTGRLHLHGVTQEVGGPVEIRRRGSGVQVSARFPVELPRFAIAKPRFLGVGVRDEVTVHVTIEMESR